MSNALVETARRLARAGHKRPPQSDLRRAVSTAYYAVFDALARLCADELIGSSSGRRSSAEWSRVYRALEHGAAKHACNQVSEKGIGPLIASFAKSFVDLQDARHRADYDPLATNHLRGDVLTLIEGAEAAIELLNRAQADHRRAFAVEVLFKKRS